jgi:hypothetical protein
MAQQIDTGLTSRNPQAEQLLAEGSDSLSTIMDLVTGVHISPPITPEDFELGRMKPLSYTREALSAAIVHNVRQSLDPKQSWTSEGRSRDGSGTKNLSPRQKQAIDRFKHQGHWSISQPSNIQDIKKFFDIFDDAYFGGLLKGYCRFELPSHWDCRDKRYGINPPLGYCQPFLLEGKFGPRDTRFRIEKPYVDITIQRHDVKSMCDRIQNYLEALLHEMLHAIFFIYSCQCEHGCRQREEYEAGSSHHMEWQAAAFAIEEADGFLRCLLGLSNDMGREVSMAGDVQRGYQLPNDAALRSVGLDIVKIRNELQWMRVRKVRKLADIKNAKSFKGNCCILNYRGRYEGGRIESSRSTVRKRYPSEFHPDMLF